MDDLQESMARVNEISEANNTAPKPDAESKGVKFRFDFDDKDVKMGETGASGAEEDTEGEQAQEVEDDTSAPLDCTLHPV
jgi:hypothetical protein